MISEAYQAKYRLRSAGNTIRRPGGKPACDLLLENRQVGRWTGFGTFDGLLGGFTRQGKATHSRKLLHFGCVKLGGVQIVLSHEPYYNLFL